MITMVVLVMMVMMVVFSGDDGGVSGDDSGFSDDGVSDNDDSVSGDDNNDGGGVSDDDNYNSPSMIAELPPYHAYHPPNNIQSKQSTRLRHATKASSFPTHRLHHPLKLHKKEVKNKLRSFFFFFNCRFYLVP